MLNEYNRIRTLRQIIYLLQDTYIITNYRTKSVLAIQ
jgi:hypothetical protein